MRKIGHRIFRRERIGGQRRLNIAIIAVPAVCRSATNDAVTSAIISASVVA
jgi:hypothetical protein